MENIHLPHRRGWIDSKVINVREFVDKWQTALSDKIWSESCQFESTVSKHDFYEAKYECRVEALKPDLNIAVEPSDHIHLPECVQLETLKAQKEDLEKRDKDPKYLTAHQAFMKFSNYPPPKIPKIEIKGKDYSTYEPLDPNVPEAVLTVQIHSPERRLDAKVVNYMKMPSFHVDQELLVLGCQHLTELRDMIDCISDKAVPGDYSENPFEVPTTTYKDIYKSGFFYINGIFYNDMRDKDCRDYSEPIIKWSEKREDIGPFKKAVMEETRFSDLSLQLGYPYLYVHQGDCEHLIIFTDLRLFSHHDEPNKNAYPMYTQVKPSKRIFCMVCHAFTAVWVVYGNKRVPENPYFFCKSCFFGFNYDENNQKIGEFKAYHYPDRSRLF